MAHQKITVCLKTQRRFGQRTTGRSGRLAGLCLAVAAGCVTVLLPVAAAQQPGGDRARLVAGPAGIQPDVGIGQAVVAGRDHPIAAGDHLQLRVAACRNPRHPPAP